MINSEQAIALSVENDGVTIVLDTFDDSDEALLRNAAEQYYFTDETEQRSRYTGAGWAVELVGCGDPQRNYKSPVWPSDGIDTGCCDDE